jgi:hypothetical protein
MVRKLLVVLLFGFSFGAFAGCEQEGPLERAGEKADRAAADTGEAVEEATEK